MPLVGLLPALEVTYFRFARPRHVNWGASRAETAAALPGDELVCDPADVTTRAVTIAATPEQVWSWLVQIGQDRAGFYSYEQLENLLGLHIRNADRINPAWQDLRVGDRVRLTPDRWLGWVPAYDLPVARMDSGSSLVLRITGPWDAVWSFHVRPEVGDSSRLIARSRTSRPPQIARAVGWLTAPAMESIMFAMERRMLLGIKVRAEHGADNGTPSTHDRK